MTDGQTVKLATERRRAYAYPRAARASVGPDVIDIRKLYAQTGMFTYDPGFTSTASCESAITYIDGDEGILLHRGYPIDQLAEHSTFMEVCLSAAQRRAAEAGRARRLHLHHHAATPCCTSSWRPSTAASGATRTRWRSCAAWSARSAPSTTTAPTSPIPKQRMIACHRLIAKMPTIAAMAYKYSVGQPFLYPRQQPHLHRQLPAHDLRRPGRAL